MPPTDPRPLGAPVLPDGIDTCLFDLDGVLTRTAAVHGAAWKAAFDAVLAELSHETGRPFDPFELPEDYTRYVDGKLRLDGVRSFLASRDIVLSEGEETDAPEVHTVHGIGARKNALFLEILRTRGVEVFEASVRYVEAVRAHGARTAVVSASKNCRAVLQAAGIEHLFELRIDGLVADERGLRGKPAPDMFLAAAAELGAEPRQAAVFEDAVSGVEAGRGGDFGWVVGVGVDDHAELLAAHGADVVVGGLGELLEAA